ncbi:DNA-binding anti-repressor SinI [Aquibacillus halophilus]|uniref:DNA-binding anti-repressor SinI n=1 Tax=Aquibacillus halophilus TaxID=930132 RepID=A0A6A8DJE2_9BACI|nr:anti-repressor SinI family protein [Aquibacillus halophilus]MRH44596.1 DNA-binding anti-repressor SinI [Aquibacillus halophilus]
MGDKEAKELDEEWISLILVAKEMGITIDDVREFLKV